MNDPEIRLNDAMRDYQIRSGNRSMIAVPLRAQEKLIGALTLADRTGRTYSDNEVALLQTFADQAALALVNARLFEELGRSNTELQTTTQYLARSLKQLGGLYTALTPIAAMASAQELMGGIIDRLMEATGADAALIRLWDQETGTLPVIGHQGFSDHYLKRVETAPAGGAVQGVMSHELRTPLNIIMGYTRLLQDEILGSVQPEQQDALKKVDYETAELLMMINSVLNPHH